MIRIAGITSAVIGRIRKGEFLLDCRCLGDLDEFSAQLIQLGMDA